MKTEISASISANSNRPLLPSGKSEQLQNSFSRLFPKKVEIQALMKFYDTNKDGNISYEEFVHGLR